MEYVILVLLIMTVAVVSVAAYVYYHPQIIIGKIQDLLYKGKPINSYEPFGNPEKKIKENGQPYITEIKYGTEYPNSYLDISYPNEDTSVVRPTVIYFHGGGFFGGDKAMGDPMAANDDANRLLNEVVAKGFNLVNVNYALVPDCHFPVPLIQMEQAIAFLKKNAEFYGLDMTNVVIFGQSAGAILAGQYGSLMVNEEYRKLLGITPSLEKDELSALIIDDAPFIISNFGLKLKLMLGNYMGTMNMRSDAVKKHNAYEYIKEGYAPSFMTAGNTDGFPDDMSAFSKRLSEIGCENEYFFIEKEVCPLPHGYLNMLGKNQYARECFDHIIAFMKKYTDGK